MTKDNAKWPDAAADPGSTGLKTGGGDKECASVEKPKRLTLDIPVMLHRAIKADCAKRGVSMVDDIVALLAKRYLSERC